MKIIQTLLLLCSFSVTFSQQNEIKIDTLELQESFKKIKSDGSEIHIDSTQKRSFIKAKQIKNVLSSYQNKNDKNYKVATDILHG